MTKFSKFIDRFIHESDKNSPEKYAKGKFFLIFQFIFCVMNLLSLPYYFSLEYLNLNTEIKVIYVLISLLLLSVFYIYPKYGYRVTFVNIHSILASFTSMYATYYFSGGIYSPDLIFTPAIAIYPFLVANRLSGIIWTIIGLIQIYFYYYADINNYLPFRDIASKLTGLDVFLTILFSVLFAIFLILLYENMMNTLLKVIKKDKIKLEQKEKEITDSIKYAMRIQQAKLPDLNAIFSVFPDAFVLFKPKDIVSGDFYFFQEKSGLYYIAAGDCTGHGVPGAIMSMIGSERLEDAVDKNSDTSDVLKHLNIGIKRALRQSDNVESTRDGMDIALCAINKNTRIVKYAGANRPLWIVRKNANQLEEIKATKAAIGGLTADDLYFNSHEIQLQQGDTIYLCTDGYADQFGGKEEKKLKTKKLKEILVNIQNKSMQDQQLFLNNFFETWRDGTEQVDDILIIGVQL